MKRFLVSRCYSEITSESAKNGDFSDNGYVFENRPMDLEEVVSQLRDCKELSSTGTLTGHEWATTGYSTSDYQTGEEREESVHIKTLNGAALAPRNLLRIFRLAKLISQRT